MEYKLAIKYNGKLGIFFGKCATKNRLFTVVATNIIDLQTFIEKELTR